MTSEILVPLGTGGLLALLFLGLSLRQRRRQRLLHDLPTSKAHGVFIGLVELSGTAESDAPLRSHLAAQPCVHYEWQVAEHWSRTVTETYRDKDGNTRTRTRQQSGWETVAQGGEMAPFYVRDETGVVRVRPDRAKIEPAEFFHTTIGRNDSLYYQKGPARAVNGSTHQRRFVERGIALHQPLYVVGAARERDDIVAPEIAATQDAELFVISTRGESKIQTGYARWSWFCWILGLIAVAVGTGLAADAGPGADATPRLLAFVASGVGAYFACWGLGWIWMVYNSLVGLRERVRQAWSLIDVQLKRRHDLMPGLVAGIGQLSTHEREVQTALAALRAQLGATQPGRAGPDPDGVAANVRAVVERYPQLTAHEGFAGLQRELVSTEQRIALARAYYNDIATQFATRLERIPDRWVAALGAMRPEPLLVAAHFERAPVEVAFAA